MTSLRAGLAIPGQSSSLTMSAGDWRRVTAPMDSPHDALPAGVPASYSWHQRGQVERGNEIPMGWSAITGWAQAFIAVGSEADAEGQALEIRGMQMHLCVISDGRRHWRQMQAGQIEGAAFRADYAGNESVQAERMDLPDGTARVRFGPGRAYHWWPRQGRSVLPSPHVCGVLTLFQSRAVGYAGTALPASAVPAYLVGGGADYWTDTGAPWDNYKTNAGVGLGPLRRVTSDWRWYGISSADDTAPVEIALPVGA